MTRIRTTGNAVILAAVLLLLVITGTAQAQEEWNPTGSDFLYGTQYAGDASCAGIVRNREEPIHLWYLYVAGSIENDGHDDDLACVKYGPILYDPSLTRRWDVTANSGHDDLAKVVRVPHWVESQAIYGQVFVAGDVSDNNGDLCLWKVNGDGGNELGVAQREDAQECWDLAATDLHGYVAGSWENGQYSQYAITLWHPGASQEEPYLQDYECYGGYYDDVAAGVSYSEENGHVYTTGWFTFDHDESRDHYILTQKHTPDLSGSPLEKTYGAPNPEYQGSFKGEIALTTPTHLWIVGTVKEDNCGCNQWHYQILLYDLENLELIDDVCARFSSTNDHVLEDAEVNIIDENGTEVLWFAGWIDYTGDNDRGIVGSVKFENGQLDPRTSLVPDMCCRCMGVAVEDAPAPGTYSKAYVSATKDPGVDRNQVVVLEYDRDGQNTLVGRGLFPADPGEYWRLEASDLVKCVNKLYLAGSGRPYINPSMRGLMTVEFSRSTEDEPDGGMSGSNRPGPQGVTYLECNPSPFSNAATVKWQAPARAAVNLSVFEVTGRLVRTLHDGDAQPGQHTCTWRGKTGDGTKVQAGVYLVTLASDNFTTTRRIVLAE